MVWNLRAIYAWCFAHSMFNSDSDILFSTLFFSLSFTNPRDHPTFSFLFNCYLLLWCHTSFIYNLAFYWKHFLSHSCLTVFVLELHNMQYCLWKQTLLQQRCRPKTFASLQEFYCSMHRKDHNVIFCLIPILSVLYRGYV